jgi:hypothetical protein
LVDKQARQVKQTRKPGNHRDDVYGLQPEHERSL